VLAAIATALKSCPPSEAAMIELTSWALDNVDSYTARANLLESLGQHATGRRSEQTLAVFERGLGIWSQHDTIRSGALAGLALYNAPGGLELAIPFTEKGNLQRLRARAIETVAELSHHDPHLAYHAIAPLLYEREEARVASAAIEALSRIEHADGLDALETFASATRHPVRAQAALAARDRLAAVLGGDASSEALQSTIERLERELGDLRSKFNERTENR
jgi:HEAT repeat protein